ncbi:uncharacterized protein LOC127790446 [Diospyros lotus]|uniref:uncharacterized protein LOC127790446 n=1 Tax=Diospyros lotus TaxID=55363 RepID=UPI002251384A|nr:uncharacterized protein LOC127790446 [Diospyros lotus]
MGFNKEVMRSSRPREGSEVTKQRTLSHRAATHILRFQDKPRIGSPSAQPWHQELRQRAGDGLKFCPKTRHNSQKPWTGGSRDDELVKHMSNLPGYLQPVEKGETFQEKALNFGVLDWERLEKWKYGKTCTLPRGHTNSSSSGNNPSNRVESKNQSCTKKQLQMQSHCQSLSSSHGGGPPSRHKSSQGKAVQQDLEVSSRNTLSEQRNSNRSVKTSGRNRSDSKLERGKKKDSNQNFKSDKETSLSGSRKDGFSHSSKDSTNAQNRVFSNRIEGLQEPTNRLGRKQCPGKHKSVVLLFPKQSPQKVCAEVVQPSDGFSSVDVHSAVVYSKVPHSSPLDVGGELPDDASCTCLDPNGRPVPLSQGKRIDEDTPSTKASSEKVLHTSKYHEAATSPAAVNGRHPSPNRLFGFGLGRIARTLNFKEISSFPKLNATYPIFKSGPVRSGALDGFSSAEELQPAKFWSEIAHSSPLPVGEPDTRHKLTAAETTELSYDATSASKPPNEALKMPLAENAVRISKKLDQEANQPTAGKGRHPSPSRRFSFALGRISRSFSFREGSVVPQPSSPYGTVKSGPVRPQVCDSLDNESRNKANNHSRARSSPLRRLLDPLLKTRATNPFHSNGTATASLYSTSEVMSGTESLPDKKHELSTVQALLQLTIENGLPVFKLILHNTSDIFVAMKKLTASGKDGTEWIYNFHSVHASKKSGSRVNQADKGKGCGFGYNTIGQMKVSSSDEVGTATEFVLYGVGQADPKTQDLMPDKELAAIIVEIPVGNSCGDVEDQIRKGKELTGNASVECLKKRETEKFSSTRVSSTTVILPGGVHGFPNKGVPSPMINRWRSRGSCDCGGWDVGCKLRILTNEDQNCEQLGPSRPCSNLDQFVLFDQGGAQGNRLIFSLASLKKGIYTVEFSSSISLLQAFSICVAVLSSQKSFDFPEVNDPSEAKLQEESTLIACKGTKTPTKTHGELPTKYVRLPPASPFGRV